MAHITRFDPFNYDGPIPSGKPYYLTTRLRPKKLFQYPMSTKKISSITEAFSQNPSSFFVEQRINADSVLKDIQAQKRFMDGIWYDYFVGYDQHLNILFEYRACSVNVHYYYKD